MRAPAGEDRANVADARYGAIIHSLVIRSAVIAPDPNAMSHRYDHLPAVIALHDGVTKQVSTPRAFATSSPVSAS
jgi:hypothetical protein